MNSDTARLKERLAALPIDPGIGRLFDAVPLEENRDRLATWLMHEWDRPARGGGPRGAPSIYSNTRGVLIFSRLLGDVPFRHMRLRQSVRIWDTIASEPDAMDRSCYPRSVGKKRLYNYKRSMIIFLTHLFDDADEALRRTPSPRHPAPPPTIPRMVPWSKVFLVLANLHLLWHRALWVLATASLLTIREITKLSLDDIRFDGRLCWIRAPPTPGFPDGRAVPLLFGADVLAAYKRERQEAGPGPKPAFPSLQDPAKPMTVSNVETLIRNWTTEHLGKASPHHDLLRGYKAWLLSTRQVHEDLITEWAGTTSDGELPYIRDEVYSALARGHQFAPLPCPEDRGIRGRSACLACGRPDNPLDARNCMFCGTQLLGGAESPRDRGIKAFGRFMAVIMDQTGLSLEEIAARALDRAGRRQPP